VYLSFLQNGLKVSDVARHHLLGGGAFSPIDQLLLLKKWSQKILLTTLAAWMPFDQLSYKFDSIGGHDAPYAPQ